MNTADTKHEPKDSRHDVVLEQTLGHLLRAGVVTAAGIVVVGAFLLLARQGGAAVPDYHHFVPPAAYLRSLPGIFAATLKLDPRGLIQFGLIVLIATPILRVAASLLGFAMERDRLYVIFTAIVLAILVFSLSGGHGM